MNIDLLQKAASDYSIERRGSTLLEVIAKLRKEIQDSKDAYQHAMNEADFAYRNISEREKELELLLKEK